jgi:hypothetical protein
MKFKLALATLLASSLAFAQNATAAAPQYVSPYYPLINSPYLAATLTLIRDITIIIVLWYILWKQFNPTTAKDKGK